MQRSKIGNSTVFFVRICEKALFSLGKKKDFGFSLERNKFAINVLEDFSGKAKFFESG